MISFLIIWLGYGLLGLGVTLWWDSKERKVTWQRVCGLAVAFVDEVFRLEALFRGSRDVVDDVERIEQAFHFGEGESEWLHTPNYQ